MARFGDPFVGMSLFPHPTFLLSVVQTPVETQPGPYNTTQVVSLICFLAVLAVEPSASCMLGKCFTTELPFLYVL